MQISAVFIKSIQEDFRTTLFVNPCVLGLVPVNARQKENNHFQSQLLTDKSAIFLRCNTTLTVRSKQLSFENDLKFRLIAEPRKFHFSPNFAFFLTFNRKWMYLLKKSCYNLLTHFITWRWKMKVCLSPTINLTNQYTAQGYRTLACISLILKRVALKLPVATTYPQAV